jgi:hypothetical protein
MEKGNLEVSFRSATDFVVYSLIRLGLGTGYRSYL